MQERIESIGGFVVTNHEALDLLFEAIQESHRETACLVAVPVHFASDIAVAAWQDDGLGPGALDGGHQGISIVALVGDDGLGRNRPDQCGALRHIRHLAGRQNGANRIARRIGTGMDLRCQSVPRAADLLTTNFFWRAAC